MADYLAGFAFAVARTVSVIGSLSVDRGAMAGNLRRAGDLAFAEAVYVLAARGGERDAHERVRQATLRVEREGRPLHEVLAGDPALWKALDAGLRSSVGCDAAAFFGDPARYAGTCGIPGPGNRGPLGGRDGGVAEGAGSMNLVVIGAQWGDEGKGKIVDYLARGADVVLRYSGGANAGHTIVHGGTTFKLHLVPSGITSPGRIVVLGIGMVIDPLSLFEELEGLERAGIDWKGRVKVADRAHIVLPRYRDIDREQEKARPVPLGTTGRGIGVAYALKSSRDGIRVVDLFDDAFMARLPQGDRGIPRAVP